MGSYLFSTFLVIIVFLQPSAEGRCNYGMLEYGGKCYLFEAKPRTFLDAMIFCYLRGMQIVELQNYKEEFWLDLFLRFKGMQTVWLGFTDIQKEGHYIALSNRQKITYSNWRKGEPNNVGGNEHCASYTTDGAGWIDYNCSDKLQFVCK